MKGENARKKIPFITGVVIILLVVAIAIAFVVGTTVNAYYSSIHSQGEAFATNYSSQYSAAVNHYVQDNIKYLKEDAEKSTVELIQNTHFDSVFYVDQEDDDNGIIDFKDKIRVFLNEKRDGVSSAFRLETGSNGLSFAFCHYADNDFYKMLIGVVSLERFSNAILNDYFKKEITNVPEYMSMALCDANGTVLGTFQKNDDGELTFNLGSKDYKLGEIKIENVFDSVRIFSGNSVEKTSMTEKMGSGYALFFSKYNDNYITSINAPLKADNNILLFHLYNAESVLTEQNNFISIIIVSILILAVIVFVLAVLGYSYRKAWITKVEYQENYEPITGCSTYKMFKDKFVYISGYNRFAKYAVIFINLTQFDILSENYGETVVNEILEFCGKVITKGIDKNEAYGHISGGKFVVAMHYKDLKDLDHKMSLIYALVNNYNKFRNVEYKLSYTAGVYLIQKGEKTTADTCLNNAIVAEKGIGLSRDKYYCIYDEKMDQDRQNEREIELRKEQAIINKEFQVYYQPKLNLNTDTLDGAEALVRWYYPEQDVIYSPAKFLHIFELDGFIEKLDRYVYLEVLAFMKRMVDSGKRVCPISVNVSRYTALQPDFLNFYIENKKKFGIADNYISIEFTESFAFDNNIKLLEIVKKLRKNGMLCSIDDFGVGYSSYSILKDLPMDEIKLDAFFMRKGYDDTRDEKTLRSVIKLGKDLGMKVTQEGVESKEDMLKLKEYGCDVLQGYLFSKPLSEILFDEFLTNKLGVHGKQKEQK